MNETNTHIRWQLPELSDDGTGTAQQYAYERLRFAIMVGGIPPGSALTIRAVAAALTLSPTPVREALKRLCAEAALTLLSNRRIITPPMTAARHQELLHVRAALETLAVTRAIPFVTDNDIEHLAAIDLKMDEAIVNQDYIQLVILNQRFHSELFQLNPEQVSLPMIESVWLQLGPYNRTAAEQIEVLAIEDWHKRLLHALRARDAVAAAKAIEADIYDGADFLQKELPR